MVIEISIPRLVKGSLENLESRICQKMCMCYRKGRFDIYTYMCVYTYIYIYTSTVISWWIFQSTMIEYQRISLGLWLYFTNQHFLKNMFFWDKTFFPGSYLNLFLGFLWIFFSTCAADSYQSSRVKRPQESSTWSQEVVGMTPGLTTMQLLKIKVPDETFI